ncbi:MAG: DUF6172 family protein [Sulfurovum sp.]|nr:DUF6172 family protein [Sulfurovum sp.]
MKKVFTFVDEKKHEDRVLEAIKNEIRKYMKREKKKDLPDKATMYWDFDCKVGATASDATAIPHEELIKALDTIKATGVSECYVEILVKAVDKPLKPEEDLEA